MKHAKVKEEKSLMTRSIPKVIFINGPPRSGKDTLARELVQRLGTHALGTKMSLPLKLMCEAFSRAVGHTRTTGVLVEDIKDSPHRLLMDKSPREFQISASEDFLKVLYGDNILGKVIARNMKAEMLGANLIDYYLISDSGFEKECYPIVDVVGVENCLLFKLYRDNCDYSNDSRDYITLNVPVVSHSLFNNSTIDNLIAEALEEIKKAWPDD